MTARRELSEVERLRLVLDTQRAINAVMADVDEVMRVVTEHAQAMTGADGGVVELAEGEEMVYRAVSGSAEGSLGTRLRADGSLSGLCVRQRVPLLSEDAHSDPRVDKEACERVGVRSMVVVPLLKGADALGVLKVLSGEPGRFEQADIDVLTLMAEFIADALVHSSSYGTLGHLATHDALTGLPNRTLLQDRLEHALRRAERQGAQIAVLFIDLDNFKVVNDRLGHAAGDEALRAVADRLSATLRSGETLARFGGDEFVLVCDDATGDAIDAVQRRVRDAVADVDAALGGPGLDVSIGCATSKDTALDASALLAEADRSMYEVKGAGRARRPTAERPARTS